MISVELNARVNKICNEINKIIKDRCRTSGSAIMWFWLAKIIRGRSQQDNTRSGVDRGSVAKYKFDVVHPASESHFIHIKLMIAITKLW